MTTMPGDEVSSLMPAGVYRAKAVGKHEVQYAYSSGGNPQMAVPFELLDGENAGRIMTWFATFGSEKQKAFNIEALKVAGWAGEDLSNLEGIGSQEVNLVIEHEEYEGRWRARVRFINARTGPRLQNQMSEAERRAFGQQMRGTVRQVSATLKLPTPKVQDAPAEAQGIDEIPF